MSERKRGQVKCLRCPRMLRADAVSETGLCRECFNEARRASQPAALIAQDREKARASAAQDLLDKKYQGALKLIDKLERQLKVVNTIKDTPIQIHEIKPLHGSGTSEGTIFWVASDWHSEEEVTLAQTSGLNEFNLDVAKERAGRFFAGGVRLTRLLEQDIKIPEIVIPLLGDFISNDIHEEIAEVTLLAPMHAIIFARDLLISGIDFTLNSTRKDQKLRFICHSGNHGRTTKTTRSATENGHSLEYLLYLMLADHYRGNERVVFHIAEGIHTYLPVYGEMFRFHHGHYVKFQGGVGGITIPVNKAIDKWNEARPAALDVFGHFHQAIDGKRFICNGSLIGYNSYAISNKFGYEPPKQQLFLVDKKRGRTCTWPILVGANRVR